MYSVHRNIFKNIRKSEGGFIFIAALMGVMILMAVGFFALTVTSQDVRISSRLIGERKALSAAEAGIHELCRQLNPANLTQLSYQQVDSARDSSTSFSYSVPIQNNTLPQLALPGYDLSKAYVGSVFDTIVTGRDANYGSEASIGIGTVYAPNPADTQQGQL